MILIAERKSWRFHFHGDFEFVRIMKIFELREFALIRISQLYLMDCIKYWYLFIHRILSLKDSTPPGFASFPKEVFPSRQSQPKGTWVSLIARPLNEPWKVQVKPTGDITILHCPPFHCSGFDFHSVHEILVLIKILCYPNPSKS